MPPSFRSSSPLPKPDQDWPTGQNAMYPLTKGKHTPLSPWVPDDTGCPGEKRPGVGTLYTVLRIRTPQCGMTKVLPGPVAGPHRQRAGTMLITRQIIYYCRWFVSWHGCCVSFCNRDKTHTETKGTGRIRHDQGLVSQQEAWPTTPVGHRDCQSVRHFHPSSEKMVCRQYGQAV